MYANMIESNIFSTSPWNFDSSLSKDLFPTIDSSFLLEDETGEHDMNIDILDEVSAVSPSPVHSLSSSTSDDHDLLTFEDINSILPISDTILSEFFEEESLIDSLNLNDLSWETSATISESVCTDSGSDSVSNVSNSSRRKRKQSRSPEYLSGSKPWSKMSPEEQLRTVNALSEVVSHRMGLREQIEVIKLIDPHVVLSPNAKEFTINLSHLTDAKLKRIKDYIKKHVSPYSSEFETQQARNSAGSSSVCHSTKRRQKRDQQPYLKELKERKLKVLRQDRKEKQSGLFVKEKKIKCLTNPHEEDEFVNVLE